MGDHFQLRGAEAPLCCRGGVIVANEKLQMSGRVEVVLLDASGRVKARKRFRNIITTAGKNWLANYLGAASPPAKMSHVAIGTGTVAAAVGDTALVAEKGTRVAVSHSYSGNVWTMVGTFGASNPSTAEAITESGILNATTSGTLMCRQTFAAINKGTADSLEITWQITFS